MMAIETGVKVETPFGTGIVTNQRKDGGVDVVRRIRTNTSPFSSIMSFVCLFVCVCVVVVVVETQNCFVFRIENARS